MIEGHYKRFIINYHFISWAHISLGFHIDLSGPNIELHVLFGFLRIGWTYSYHPNEKTIHFSSAYHIRNRNES